MGCSRAEGKKIRLMCVVPEEKEVREGEVRQAMKQGGEDEQKSEGGVMKGRRV